MLPRPLSNLETPHQFAGWLPRVGRAEDDIWCGYLELACASIAASTVDDPLVGEVQWMDRFLDAVTETPAFSACFLAKWKETHVTTAPPRAANGEQTSLFQEG